MTPGFWPSNFHPGLFWSDWFWANYGISEFYMVRNFAPNILRTLQHSKSILRTAQHKGDILMTITSASPME